MTVVYTSQCPYMEDAKNAVLEFAQEMDIKARGVELKTSAEVQQSSPTPYGVYALVLDGKLLTYHYILKKDLPRLLSEQEVT
jgi:hypothetical protein